MTATDINIEKFIKILTEIRDSGVKLMDLDMVQDDNYPEMNKLIIHPNKKDYDSSGNSDSDKQSSQKTKKEEIRNPNISIEGDDIFNRFSDLV